MSLGGPRGSKAEWFLRLELYELMLYCTWSFGAAESSLQTSLRTLETRGNVFLFNI